MSFDRPMSETDAPPCRYGDSRLAFRGPAVDLDQPHVAILGSSEVLGRYAPRPMHMHLSEALGVPVANLGVQNAGVDVFVQDDVLLEEVNRAEVAVVQVMGAHNLSNRLYSVHPRRNDRFLRHSDKMRALYPDVDFSDFVFTRHMLGVLSAHDAERFAVVAEELRTAWVARMRLLMESLTCPTVLLWIEGSGEDALGCDPLYVTPEMMEAARAMAHAFAHADVTAMADGTQLDEMVFDPAEIESARMALPPVAHEAVAAQLVRTLASIMPHTALRPAGGEMPPRRDRA